MARESSGRRCAAIKRQMRDAFYDDSVAWQAIAYGQARTAVLQAVRSLASNPDARVRSVS
jgi:hypothetical protein